MVFLSASCARRRRVRPGDCLNAGTAMVLFLAVWSSIRRLLHQENRLMSEWMVRFGSLPRPVWRDRPSRRIVEVTRTRSECQGITCPVSRITSMLFEEESHADGFDKEAILNAVEGAPHLEIAAVPLLTEVSSPDAAVRLVSGCSRWRISPNPGRAVGPSSCSRRGGVGRSDRDRVGRRCSCNDQ